MSKWYVKDLSKLTHVSVQTLHHYDRIGLLKPSLRLDNGYRVYGEQDLSRLQQIIALKFFGFELAKIKELLLSDLNVLEHLAAQSRLLEQKAEALRDASQKLQHIVKTSRQGKSIPWEKIIETIEVYRMTKEIENSWAGKVLSPEELQQYIKFSKGLETRFNADEKEKSHADWADLAKEVNASVRMDPASDKAQAMAKRMMDWVNQIYGSEFAELRRAVWEKGFQRGNINDEHGMTPEAVEWIDKAIDHYYRSRILKALSYAGQKPDAEVLREWNLILQEMCGDSDVMKKEITDAALEHKDVSEIAKKLLRK